MDSVWYKAPLECHVAFLDFFLFLSETVPTEFLYDIESYLILSHCGKPFT